MTDRELVILNSLVTYAAENIPGGLSTEEAGVALIVGLWAQQKIHVAPVCPHCGAVAPYGDARHQWLRVHIDSAIHRWWWAARVKFAGPYGWRK